MTKPSDFGAAVRSARRALKLRQAELAAAAGVGLRFVVELEGGKPTAELGKVLAVFDALGLDCEITSRADARARQDRR
jgi:HTH-type transcriptional regulator/antitoxin HipB